MRLAQARSSKDLDLLRLGELSADQAIDELRALTTARDGDHLRFVIHDGVTYSRLNPVVEIRVTAYCGAQYGTFSIDLARDLHLLARPERVQPSPVVEVPGLPGPPQVVVYPLTDQVADKVCAMYELYGERQLASTRYRDLVDLVLIVGACQFDADPAVSALTSESKRRVMTLPHGMEPPAPGWAQGYQAYANQTPLRPDLRQLDAALKFVGRCVNPLLEGQRTGRWDPELGWVE